MGCLLGGTSVAESSASPSNLLLVHGFPLIGGKMPRNSCGGFIVVNLCVLQCLVKAQRAGLCMCELCLVETICLRSEFAVRWRIMSFTLNVKLKVKWSKQYCCVPRKPKALTVEFASFSFSLSLP